MSDLFIFFHMCIRDLKKQAQNLHYPYPLIQSMNNTISTALLPGSACVYGNVARVSITCTFLICLFLSDSCMLCLWRIKHLSLQSLEHFSGHEQTWQYTAFFCLMDTIDLVVVIHNEDWQLWIIFLYTRWRSSVVVSYGNHILGLEKEDTGGRTALWGRQAYTRNMNGVCRKRTSNPRHFWWFRSPTPDAFLRSQKEDVSWIKRTYGHPRCLISGKNFVLCLLSLVPVPHTNV